MLSVRRLDSNGSEFPHNTDSKLRCPTAHRRLRHFSYKEVDEIVQKFAKLNPYNCKLVPGSILKVHKLNWGSQQTTATIVRLRSGGQAVRSLYAAKRYGLYTKTRDEIEIVEPKAHGLGYFYPPKDSPEGWKHETPQWIFEAWDWIIRGVLGLKRCKPSWFNLPVMMKLTLSTPHHALKNLAKGPLTRANNFMMVSQISRFGYPSGVDPNKCTFITSFSPERDQWTVEMHQYPRSAIARVQISERIRWSQRSAEEFLHAARLVPKSS